MFHNDTLHPGIYIDTDYYATTSRHSDHLNVAWQAARRGLPQKQLEFAHVDLYSERERHDATMNGTANGAGEATRTSVNEDIEKASERAEGLKQQIIILDERKERLISSAPREGSVANKKLRSPKDKIKIG